MKFKACLLAYLLLVVGNASAGNDEILKFIFNAFKAAGSLGKLYSTQDNVKALPKKNKFAKHPLVVKKDFTVEVFNPQGTGNIVFKYKDGNDRPCSIATLSDGSVVVGFYSGKIRIFSSEFGICIPDGGWQAHKEDLVSGLRVKTIVVDDSEYIISSQLDDPLIRVWNEWGQCIKEFKTSLSGSFFSMGLVPNVEEKGMSLWCANHNRIEIFNWYSKKLNKSVLCECGRIRQIVPNGLNTMVLGHNKIMVFDSKTAKCLKKCTFDESGLNRIYSMIPVPDTNYILLGFLDGPVQLFDWLSGKVVKDVCTPKSKKCDYKAYLPDEGILLENVIAWKSKRDDLKEEGWPIGLLPTKDGKLVQVIHIDDNKIELKQIFPEPDIVKE